MDIVDNMDKFLRFREEYSEFWYNGFSLREDEEAFVFIFDFEIPGLAKFAPRTRILKKTLPWRELLAERREVWAFNIGMAELVSYWKATCSPKVVIKCGSLSDEQKRWWKKLYYYGLGELFYRNGITTTQDEFMTIECDSVFVERDSMIVKHDNVFEKLDSKFLERDNTIEKLDGYIIPIGGGKDSIATLETLPIDHARDYAAIMNPKPVTLKCAELAGFARDQVVEIERKIDGKLLELNAQGFINGHTPFSSVLAFYLSFAAEALGKKYVVVSNENSANEANVSEVDANHQYSKSFEFEEDFRCYAHEFIRTEVEYFSFLRPLNELEIGKIFARHEKYFDTFKSCNVGSKSEPWRWCGDCPKCLFAFVILAPYLYRDELVEIFGQDLFERGDLWTMLLQLTGDYANKPFECVGTYAEVQLALRLVIDRMQGEKLPILLEKYQAEYGAREVDYKLMDDWNMENNLNGDQEDALRKALYAE